MRLLVVSALATLAAQATTVAATGPQVVFSKTWYEPQEYYGVKMIFRHFTFTFDQPLFIHDKKGTVASVADQVWYRKLAADGISYEPRLICTPKGVNTFYSEPSDEPFEPEHAEPVYLGQTRNNWFGEDVDLARNGYVGCNPYMFRALDGNFILTDVRAPFIDPVQIAGNSHFNWASNNMQIPRTVRWPDMDGTALYPGIKANDRDYNSTSFYWDLLNYRVNDIPYDLIDSYTITLSDLFYIEQSPIGWQNYKNGMMFYDTWNVLYGSANVLFWRTPYARGYTGGSIAPILTLICNTQPTADQSYSYHLETWDFTFNWPITPEKRSKLLNAAGEESISGAPANLNWNTAKCTPQDLELLNDKYADIQAQMLKANNAQALTTLQVSLKTLALQYPYDACFAYINSLYNTTTTTIEVPSVTECQHNYGTLQYAVDPCCNMTLSFTQCCAPKTITKSTTVASAISNGTQCVNPAAAFTAIQTLVAGLNTGDQINADDLAVNSVAKLTSFQGECQRILFNSTCSTAEQCQYGSTCDFINQICIPPYDQLTAATLSCYEDHMDHDLKNRLIAQLGVALDADGKPIASDFLAKFSAAVVRDDCVGPTAAAYRTRYQYDNGRLVTDSFGEPIVIAGSQTSCLAERQCAFNTAPGQQCEATQASGDHFCGLCNDNTCIEITRPAQCVVTAYTTPNTCAASGFYWSPLDTQSVYSRYFPGQTGICVDLNANTEDKCLSATVCPASTTAVDSLTRCANQFCYNSQLNSQRVCEKIDGDWKSGFANGAGLCVDAFDPEDDDDADDFNLLLKFTSTKWTQYLRSFKARQQANKGCHNGFTRFTGRVFIPGKFNTAESCAVGQCSIRNDNLQYNYETETLNAQQCSALQQCTTTCPRCRSAFSIDSNAATELVCYETKQTKPEIQNANKCYRDGGVWTRLSDKSYICRYHVDKKTCVAAEHQVADCSSMTKDTCYSSNSPIDQLLQCHWSANSACPLNTCSQQGFCNDAEFINTRVAVGRNGAQPTGACMIPAPIDSVEARPCGLIPTLNNSTVYKYQIQSKVAGLCLDFSVDKTTCSAAGFTFQDVASTADQCAAHGSNCFEADGKLTAKPQQQCETCGGSAVAAYRWTAAHVENGLIRSNTQWKTRETVSVNSWKPTVVFPLLDALIGKVTLRKVAVEQISAVSLHMSTVLSMMNSLSCDCTSFMHMPEMTYELWWDLPTIMQEGDLRCYQKPPIQQAIGDLVPGSAIQLFTTTAVLFVDQTAGFGMTKTIELGYVPATTLTAGLSAFAVTDADGVIVAYLAGHGLNLNASVQAGTAITTLQTSVEVGTAIPTEFSAAGVAQLVNDQLQLLETDSNFVNSATAVQTPSINAAGTYFPVKVTAQTQQTLTVRYAARVAELKKSAASMTSASIIIIALLSLIQLLF